MRLARCGMVFSPADPPRLGTVDLIDAPAPGLADLPGARRGELTVTEPGTDGIELRRVPVVRLPLATALPLLAGLRREEETHPDAFR